MKKRLYIHFGVQRTGTTHLQRVLKHNRHSLLQQGVLYPELGGGGENHSHIAWGLLSNKLSSQALMERLKKEIPDAVDKIILSHEDFSQLREYGWLKDLAGLYDVEVIVYLRRQELWLESWYNQHIKWPWDKKFSHCTPEFFLQNYKDFYWIDYARLLEAVTSVLGSNNVYVNVVDSLGVSNTTNDFIEHVGIQCDIPDGMAETNASISTAKLDVLRRIDLLTLKNNTRAKVKILNRLKEMKIEGDDGKKIVFTDKQVEFILDEFQDSNRAVAQRYFGREELFADPIQWGRKPCFVPDFKAYRVYIPQLLKDVACA